MRECLHACMMGHMTNTTRPAAPLATLVAEVKAAEEALATIAADRDAYTGQPAFKAARAAEAYALLNSARAELVRRGLDDEGRPAADPFADFELELAEAVAA
ncbi:hypothetical protein SEA_ZETA1847_61 [Microbacterium phage Zeta1847]|uniref:Uncharacterized protein n=1 Tax=Microbacterium phage Zeta1847 TaxID=2201444 RepID=A0A2Z4Q9W5_9CAUD|nr:hypothetical protein HOT46_gp61 [Microbacterium phage Zeta1847]AWY06695.1 hypothetical protein SEA_ZETA1847_61 [Microbacterium phage Zeta1847]